MPGTPVAGGTNPASNPAARLAPQDPDRGVPRLSEGRFDRLPARWMRVATRLIAPGTAPAVVLLLLPFAVYHRALTPGWTIADLDLLFHVVPYHTFLLHAWRAGDWLPLWDSHIFLGSPFLANIQGAALYPQNLLLALVPVSAAIDWLAALHVGIAGAGMYLFCFRVLRLRRT